MSLVSPSLQGVSLRRSSAWWSCETYQHIRVDAQGRGNGNFSWMSLAIFGQNTDVSSLFAIDKTLFVLGRPRNVVYTVGLSANREPQKSFSRKDQCLN